MSARSAMRRVFAAGAFLVALVLHPRIARADRTLAEALFDFNVGPVVPVSPRAVDGTLFVIGVPLQFPVSPFDRAPFLRVVLEPALVFGTRSNREATDTAGVTFRYRAGLRFVAPIGRHFQVVTGVGTTFDFWPFVRSSFSPELAVRVRLRRCEHDFMLCAAQHAVVGARMDFYAAGANAADVTFLVGIVAF